MPVFNSLLFRIYSNCLYSIPCYSEYIPIACIQFLAIPNIFQLPLFNSLLFRIYSNCLYSIPCYSEYIPIAFIQFLAIPNIFQLPLFNSLLFRIYSNCLYSIPCYSEYIPIAFIQFLAIPNIFQLPCPNQDPVVCRLNNISISLPLRAVTHVFLLRTAKIMQEKLSSVLGWKYFRESVQD